MSVATNEHVKSLIPLPLVGFGGAAGTVLRHGLLHLDWSPSATLLMINLIGSALLGALSGIYLGREGQMVPARWLALVGVGFCGGFTTFSGHMVEVATRLDDGQWNSALLSLTGTSLLCIGGAIAGFVATRPSVGHSRP
jgi:CrcB protein